VENHGDGHGEISGKLRDQITQGLRSTGGDSDDHQVNLGRASAEWRGCRGGLGLHRGEQGARRRFDLFRELLADAENIVVGEGGGLAHEIKNPLASLSGSIQLLKSELSPDASEAKLMKIVLRETDRLDELLTNFLCYAKPAQLTVTMVRYRELVADILTLLQNSMEEESRKRIQFKNELTENDQCLADEGKLKQVFWNLLKNAVSAIDKDGVIVVRAGRQQREGVEFLKISIEDSGAGIAADDVGRIFEPFFTRKVKGTGLGLAVVYQSIQAHRGHIGVNSQPGKGSEFWFEVPVKGPNGVEQNARSAA